MVLHTGLVCPIYLLFVSKTGGSQVRAHLRHTLEKPIIIQLSKAFLVITPNFRFVLSCISEGCQIFISYQFSYIFVVFYQYCYSNCCFVSAPFPWLPRAVDFSPLFTFVFCFG